MAAKQDGEEAGVIEPGKTPPAGQSPSPTEGAARGTVKSVNSAEEMRHIAGLSVLDLDRESQSWTQWFMYGTSAPIGLIRHTVMSGIYDIEAVRQIAFPRSHRNFPPSHSNKGQSHFRRSMSVLDGEYPVLNASGSGVDVTIGYRLYPFRRRSAPRPVVVHFHGNAETVADMDGLVALYRGAGCSVLAVDFRGYGWSTGTPSLVTLTSDAAAIMHHLPKILRGAGLQGAPCVLAGRSLGSACAIELAARFERSFVGLILESAVMSLLELPMVAEALGGNLAASLPDPFLNSAKLARLKGLRVLMLHGLDDDLVPASQAETLFEACGVTAEQKELCILAGCGHDDLSDDERYENVVAAFLDSFLPDFIGAPASAAAEDEAASLSLPSWAGCFGCFSHRLSETEGCSYSAV